MQAHFAEGDAVDGSSSGTIAFPYRHLTGTTDQIAHHNQHIVEYRDRKQDNDQERQYPKHLAHIVRLRVIARYGGDLVSEPRAGLLQLLDGIMRLYHAVYKGLQRIGRDTFPETYETDVTVVTDQVILTVEAKILLRLH